MTAEPQVGEGEVRQRPRLHGRVRADAEPDRLTRQLVCPLVVAEHLRRHARPHLGRAVVRGVRQPHRTAQRLDGLLVAAAVGRGHPFEVGEEELGLGGLVPPAQGRGALRDRQVTAQVTVQAARLPRVRQRDHRAPAVVAGQPVRRVEEHPAPGGRPPVAQLDLAAQQVGAATERTLPRRGREPADERPCAPAPAGQPRVGRRREQHGRLLVPVTGQRRGSLPRT
jgi:hypothetical protein